MTTEHNEPGTQVAEPIRCHFGRYSPEPCENPATVDVSGPLPKLLCEEHARHHLEERLPEGWAEHGAEEYARYCEEAATFLHRHYMLQGGDGQLDNPVLFEILEEAHAYLERYELRRARRRLVAQGGTPHERGDGAPGVCPELVLLVGAQRATPVGFQGGGVGRARRARKGGKMHVETDGPNVRALREASESSTRKFAKKAGVSRRTLTRVERNEGPVRPDTARKIGAALDVDPRTFARAVSRRPGPKEGEVSAKNTTEASPFLAEIERLMAEKGIEDLEELHERFMEQEPERIGNARWTFERFRKHATNVAGGLHFKFMRPLVRALEATDREQERLFFAWVGWDPPSGA